MTLSLHHLPAASTAAASAPGTSSSLIKFFPPKPPRKTPPQSRPRNGGQLHSSKLQNSVSRRDAVLASLSLLSLLTSLSKPAPASAFSIGISGPKEWLKEQKKKSSKFLLAPIDASREILRAAYLILTRDSDYSGEELEEVRRLSRSAARDCVAEDRNSFVAFQANTGVEVCTFRLIVKNAASLLANKDPVKLEAEAKLVDLIRSFSSLNGLASESDLKDVNTRQKVADAVMETMSSLDKFERGIKDCLEI